MTTTYLFAPGNNPKLLTKVFDTGTDAVILDLEDAVPPSDKAYARSSIATILSRNRAWVRVNAVESDDCRADLELVAEHALGIRIPKVERPEDVEWISARAPGLPLICAIETARGVLAAHEIAQVPSCTYLAMGGIDLRKDLGAGDGFEPLIHARSQLVLAASAAGIDPPIDSVYGQLADLAGLQAEAERSKALGFFGKSAIHPNQLPIIRDVFMPSADEIQWARDVLDAFEAAGHGATRLASGEFVDVPVARRAERILRQATS